MTIKNQTYCTLYQPLLFGPTRTKKRGYISQFATYEILYCTYERLFRNILAVKSTKSDEMRLKRAMKLANRNAVEQGERFSKGRPQRAKKKSNIERRLDSLSVADHGEGA